MIDGVADHVHQRIGQFFDHVAVEFGIFAAQFQIGLFARLSRQIPNQAGHASEQLPDRDHPHRHRDALHVGGDAGQVAQIARQSRTVNHGHIRIVLDQRLRDDQLADHFDEIVELAGVYFDGARSGGCFEDGCRRRLCGRRGRGRRCRGRRRRGKNRGSRAGTNGAGTNGLGRGFRRRFLPTRRLPLNHRHNARHQRRSVGGRLRPCFNGRQTLGHVIGALQNHVDENGVDWELRVPGQIEQSFHFVRETLNEAELQKSGQPFDGVKATKNGVNGFTVLGVLFEG